MISLAFPGWFNPAHRGHTQVLQVAIESLCPSKVTCLVLDSRPNVVMPSVAYRVELLTKAIAEGVDACFQPMIKVMAVKGSDGNKAYASIKNKDRIHWLVGSDEIGGTLIPSKTSPKNFRLVVAQRDGHKVDPNKVGISADWLTGNYLRKLSTVSGEQIRHRLAAGESISRYVHDANLLPLSCKTKS